MLHQNLKRFYSFFLIQNRNTNTSLAAIDEYSSRKLPEKNQLIDYQPDKKYVYNRQFELFDVQLKVFAYFCD